MWSSTYSNGGTAGAVNGVVSRDGKEIRSTDRVPPVNQRPVPEWIGRSDGWHPGDRRDGRHWR
jgi:hypothetical protein